MTTIRVFFQKLGHLFSIFGKGQGRPPPPTSSYAPEPNLIFDSGVHDSIKIVIVKLFTIHSIPILCYFDHMIVMFQKPIRQADWESLFYKKPVHYQVSTFNEIFTNIFTNFVPFLLIDS